MRILLNGYKNNTTISKFIESGLMRRQVSTGLGQLIRSRSRLQCAFATLVSTWTLPSTKSWIGRGGWLSHRWAGRGLWRRLETRLLSALSRQWSFADRTALEGRRLGGWAVARLLRFAGLPIHIHRLLCHNPHDNMSYISSWTKPLWGGWDITWQSSGAQNRTRPCFCWNTARRNI